MPDADLGSGKILPAVAVQAHLDYLGDALKNGFGHSHRRKEIAMKAAVIFTGLGPILILTSHDKLNDPDFVARMAAKGIDKFIAHEIPVSVVQHWYGPTFNRALTETTQEDELRIVDVDGQHIFCNLQLSDLGLTVRCEQAMVTAC